jgi:hypothetical protein
LNHHPQPPITPIEPQPALPSPSITTLFISTAPTSAPQMNPILSTQKRALHHITIGACTTTYQHLPPSLGLRRLISRHQQHQPPN